MTFLTQKKASTLTTLANLDNEVRWSAMQDHQLYLVFIFLLENQEPLLAIS